MWDMIGKVLFYVHMQLIELAHTYDVLTWETEVEL